MIDYIIKSTLCLSALLVIYHLFLEHEKMHRFNRGFLLFGLVFGLLIPKVSLFASSMAQPVTELLKVTEIVAQPASVSSEVVKYTAPQSSWISILFIIYCIGACVLMARFAVNIIAILGRVKKARIIQSAGANIVLVKDSIVPHSFFRYLFLQEEAYMNRLVPPEIIAHELTHLRQKHSFDILFIELLRILFWFNPIFIFYKIRFFMNQDGFHLSSFKINYRISHANSR